MRFYTQAECEQWIRDRKRVTPNVANAKPSLRLRYPSSSAYLVYSWARTIASSITFQGPCLLWITEWAIWSSSENLHLYYRLRQSYHDTRLISEAPGHLFLGHETIDLASFLQIAMLNGWGGHVLTAADYVNAFFSHDEFIDFYSDNASMIDQLRIALTGDKLTGN